MTEPKHESASTPEEPTERESWEDDGFLTADQIAERWDRMYVTVEVIDGVPTEVRTFPRTAPASYEDLPDIAKPYDDRMQARIEWFAAHVAPIAEVVEDPDPI